jgi:RNA-directed DNA polymerase
MGVIQWVKLRTVGRESEEFIEPVIIQTVKLHIGKDGFDFLGFHHRTITVENRNGKYVSPVGQFPSKKSMNGMREKIRAILSNRNTLKEDIFDMVKIINRRLTGFKNYYGFGYPKKKLKRNLCI